jgi:hypothetical protein
VEAPDFTFLAPVIEWRGPAPFFFVAIPAEHSDAIRDAARTASYGWGVVPVEAEIRAVVFTTSLFPRGGDYLLPLKIKVRRDADIAPDEMVLVEMRIGTRD